MSSQFSADAQKKVSDFEIADDKYKTAWEAFETQNATMLAALDKLREDRNNKLDEATRALRTEAEALDISAVKRLTIGRFIVQKRWSDFYIADKLVPMLKDRQVYDHAINAKIVAEKVEVAKYNEIKTFLKAHGLEKDFEVCEDGEELTPAVTAPKPIPTFGAESKEKK
jgi:hypothetical protein